MEVVHLPLSHYKVCFVFVLFSVRKLLNIFFGDQMTDFGIYGTEGVYLYVLYIQYKYKHFMKR